MKGFYYWMLWGTMCILVFFAIDPLLSILVAILANLDAQLQNTSNIMKILKSREDLK